MSTILNTKEDVLRVEMTKHGRMLLGMGRFKPEYFSFFDDTIVYDAAWAGFTGENINSIEDRILYSTIPFTSLNLLEKNKDAMLGQSDPFSDYAPSWSIKALNGKITYKREESSYYKKKFNFNDLLCNISFQDVKTPNENIIVQSDYILLDITEQNVGEDISNFEIEFIYVDPLMSGSKNSVEHKLLFISSKTNIIDDMIYDETELPSSYFDVEFNQNHVSYYFDILVDEEIDTEYIRNAGLGIYETVKGFVSGIPLIIPRGSETDPAGGTDTSDAPNINTSAPEGTKISLGPNGQIISADPLITTYDGNICKLECCP